MGVAKKKKFLFHEEMSQKCNPTVLQYILRRHSSATVSFRPVYTRSPIRDTRFARFCCWQKQGGGEGERDLMGSVEKKWCCNRATKDERSNLYVTFV